MIRGKNYAEFKKRGAFQSDYGEFYIVKCSNCGRFALYDHEFCMLYFDCSNLSNSELYINDNAPKCPSCSKASSYDKASDEDYDMVAKSEWAFALEESHS